MSIIDNTSSRFVRPPSWMLDFRSEYDGVFAVFNEHTATKNIIMRSLRSKTYNGKVQRRPERDPEEASSEI